MSGLPRAFSIGLSPVAEPETWLAPDDDLERFLDEKDRLIEACPERVFMAEADTGAAQDEIARLLTGHLTAAFPDVYQDAGHAVRVAGRIVEIYPDGGKVLQDVARLVADDLVLMRRKTRGWTLVAASLCFPTYWKLSEKFGRPITAIHEPVPGFGPGTRNAMLVERIFDHLQEGRPVQRSNWSIHNDGELHHVEPHGISVRCDDDKAMGNVFLRREYQTLTRLPGSGDILFTIRVNTRALKNLDGDRVLKQALAERLSELDAAGLDYKGLAEGRDLLADYLQRRAGA